jgi:hypothetical protein
MNPPVEIINPPVLLQLTLKRFGNSRKGNLAEIQTGADKKLLSLSKRLLDCAEFRALMKIDTKILNFIRSGSIPSMFKAGVYQVKPMYVPQIDEYLQDMADARAEAVSVLCDYYQARVDEARMRLGPQFRDRDYPGLDRFREKFGMVWRFFTMGAPSQVEGLDPEFVRREAERLNDMFEEARQEGVALIRTQFKELVDHLVDRLTPDPDGTRKRFNASVVKNMDAFIQSFDMRNISGDADLETLITQARNLMAGAVPDVIRESENLRDTIREGFVQLKTELDPLVENVPRRFVNVEDLDSSED